MDERRARTRFVLAIVGLLCVAGIVRAAPLTAGLPYTSYVDEGHVLRPAAHMLAHRTRDPGEYQYPPLLISTIAVSGLVYDGVHPDDMAAAARQVDGSEYYDEIEPSNLVVIGRLITFVFALGTVLVTVVLGSHLVGRFGGLVAGLVVAFMPALVQRSPVVIVDTPAAFFVMLTLLVTLKLGSSRRPLLWAALAGAAAAGAFVSKYPAGAVFLAVVVVLALQSGRPWRSRLAQGVIAAVTAAAVAVVVMPALYRRPGTVVNQIQTAAEKYEGKATPQSYFEQLVSVREVGVLMVGLSVVGLFFLLRSHRSRVVTLGWLAFAVVQVGSLLWTDFQPFRNVLPVVPFLGVAVAAAVLAFGRRIDSVRASRELERPVAPRAIARPVALTITLALCLTMLVWGVLPVTRLQTIEDSRREAREWLQRTADDSDQILVAEELAFLPSELERLPGEVTVLRADVLAEADPSGFDYALWGRFTHPEARGGILPLQWEYVREFGTDATPSAPAFGRGSHELIAIYRT
jgi:hypothetical protein